MSVYSVASFFSGAGGLDLGFESTERFEITWANEYDRRVFDTFRANFPSTMLVGKSIETVHPDEIPEVHGFVGGPPCQSWSEAGARRGIDDPRGQLFNTYIKLLAAKKPAFFLAENVSGILFQRNADALNQILHEFSAAGYDVHYGLLNASDYGVPQDRERVIFVGFRTDLQVKYQPPTKFESKVTLREAIARFDANGAVPVASIEDLKKSVNVPNHHYFDSSHYSFIYMSRNRRRGWDECSFTIQATASHAPLHPSSPEMRKLDIDKWEFTSGTSKTRRLSVRECAAIQTFPDDFVFTYENINSGYRMVGNAVPVLFAKSIAESIAEALSQAGLSHSMPVAPKTLNQGVISRY